MTPELRRQNEIWCLEIDLYDLYENCWKNTHQTAQNVITSCSEIYIIHIDVSVCVQHPLNFKRQTKR